MWYVVLATPTHLLGRYCRTGQILDHVRHGQHLKPTESLAAKNWAEVNPLAPGALYGTGENKYDYQTPHIVHLQMVAISNVIYWENSKIQKVTNLSLNANV